MAGLLAAMDTWASRYSVNPMGISYLDMGDAFMRGDWHTALNGLWSPLYSLPLGLLNRLVQPSLSWEFPLVHLVNFFCFIAALFAFDFLLRELLKWKQLRITANGEQASSVVPDWTIVLLGYAIFIWCSLGLVRMATTAPDMLLSVFIYLAFGLLLRMDRGHANLFSFFILGLVVGFGYLAKAPMLPLGILFILVGLLLVRGGWRKSIGRLAVAMLGLILIAGPFIIALSASRHRLTFGDSSTLNYAWHVNRVPFFHWQGDAIHGTPKHPTRKIYDSPSVYEFATPLNATYSPWYDPSYWYEGVRPRFNLAQQKVALIASLRVYWELLTFRSHLTLLVGFLLLLYISRKNRPARMLMGWKLFILPAAAVLMFLPVHAEPRYVVAFIPPFWLLLFASLPAPPDRRGTKYVVWIMIGMAAVIMFAQASRSVLTFWQSANDPSRRAGSAMQMEVAAELTQRGLAPGDPVGLLNFNPHWLPVTHWARLSRLRIVAELPNSQSAMFAATDELGRRRITDTFAKTGAKVLIATHVPEDVQLPGWERLNETSYYVLKLDHNDAESLSQPVTRTPVR